MTEGARDGRRWLPPGFLGRAVGLVALATLPWLVWLAWPAARGPAAAGAPPTAEAQERLASLSTIVAGWEADANAVAADPVIAAALAVGDDGGLSDLLGNHETVARYANALVIDPEFRVRAFARPTRWAGLRVPRAGDPLGRVLDASRIADGPVLSPLAATGSAAVLYIATPIRDGGRRLGTLVLVAGPNQFEALLGTAGVSPATRHELLVAVDGAWHRLEMAGDGDARLARRPADPEMDRLLLEATTGAGTQDGSSDPRGARAALVARNFAPLNAVLVVSRAPGSPEPNGIGELRPSVLWPLAVGAGFALVLAWVLTGRERPATNARPRPRRREPVLSSGRPEAAQGPGMASGLGALLGRLGPELRAPLAAILGTAELAAPEVTEPRLAIRIERIRTSATALLRYLDDLALLADLESGRTAPAQAPYRLRDVLVEVARRTATTVAAAESELVFRRGAGVPDLLSGDGERLVAVLVRLVEGVRRRLPPGRPLRIEIETSTGAAAGDPDPETSADAPMLIVTVHAADAWLDSHELFSGASVIDRSSEARPDAASIALAIAARAAESLGAEALWIADGDPPAFRVELPLIAAADAAPARPSLRGRRAMVVDELGISAEILSEALARAGLEVHEAPNLAAAISELRRAVPPRAKPYDLLLVDDRVPDIDRLAGVLDAGAEGPALPPIVLLGTPGRSGMRSRPADARIERPLDEPVVLDVVAAVLGLAPLATTSPAEPVAAAGGGVLAGRRLLLVEDNDINREVGVELLQRAGAAVDTAADGRAALEALAAGRAYDAVLMDLEMPRMDGLSATRAIRALPGRADLPIIAWTAHVLTEDRKRCLEAGMSDCLPKPIAPEHLYAAIARWTGGAAEASLRVEDAPSARDDVDHPPPLDATAAIRYLGDDEKLYRRLLATFIAEHAEDDSRIRSAIAAGRRSEAREATHALKGLAATLGLMPLSRVAASIELCLRAGSGVPDAVLDALRDRLAEAVASAGAWLELECPAPSSWAPPDAEAIEAGRDAQWSLLDEQIARGELGALGTFERLAASRRPDLDEAEWEAVHDALARLDFERAAELRRKLG